MTTVARASQLDVYNSDAYLLAASLLQPEGELHVLRHGEAVVPLIVRPLPDNCDPGRDSISPYDFAGPALNGECARQVWAALATWARQRGVVTVFLRFHPFFGEAEAWSGLEGLAIRRSANNIVIELTDAAEMLPTFKPTVRRDLRVARREGVEIEFAPINSAGLEEFVSLYRQTMHRVEASAFYRFPQAFFDRLAEDLHKVFSLATARINCRAVASSLILLEGATAYYYLTGFDYDARQTRPMNMLVYETACRLYAMGFERFHLGGGSPGLRAFKERFGSKRVPYFVGRGVFDRARYAELSRGRAGDFFPAYRAH